MPYHDHLRPSQALVDRGGRVRVHRPWWQVRGILQRYNQRKSREHLLFEAKQMRRLIFPELIESGYMHPGRWRHIADTYAALGMMRQEFPLTSLLYNRNPKQNLRWLYLSTAGAVALTLLVSGMLARFYTLNRQHIYRHPRPLAWKMVTPVRGYCPGSIPPGYREVVSRCCQWL